MDLTMTAMVRSMMGARVSRGKLSVALTVKAAGFTKSAKAKIEAAGGSCQDLSQPSPAPTDSE